MQDDRVVTTTVTFLSPLSEPVGTVLVAVGESVMHAAVQADVQGIEAECGGCLSCATCHVYVLQFVGELLSPTQEEVGMLEFVAADRRAESRLSCQLLGREALEKLVIQLPDRQV